MDRSVTPGQREVETRVDVDAHGCERAAEIVAAFVEHAANPVGPPAEHLRPCPDCASAVPGLRAPDAPGPDLERRLLRDFRTWRNGA